MLKTGRAQLCICGAEVENIYIFKETRLFRRSVRTLRKSVTVETLARHLNSGKWQLEFIHEYHGYNSVIYSCWIWFDRKPYHMECQLELICGDIEYQWNEIREDREW